ncbi:hypothetical protein BN8_05614 [Fibrisoma limi BUZ 3]|uniref:Uncharacterized protein n=1 Tax=Fibrisoma limi BUZ 3 TaxID=1185876 RepID=I2GQW1_9BACT|nr:hypothetical protein BN8_05614 [Fibrisoma limi BUZ 3]
MKLLIFYLKNTKLLVMVFVIHCWFNSVQKLPGEIKVSSLG